MISIKYRVHFHYSLLHFGLKELVRKRKKTNQYQNRETSSGDFLVQLQFQLQVQLPGLKGV